MVQEESQGLPDLWKGCVENLCNSLSLLEREMGGRFSEIEKKEAQELQKLSLFVHDASELRKACQMQIDGLQSSVLSLANSFQS